ncbi:MAG: hypothetical protein QOK16_4663 [Solirubrobacteraceae bacterium]|nr:hypothetical protein [Solirubrobacteraceae bacterium]
MHRPRAHNLAGLVLDVPLSQLSALHARARSHSMHSKRGEFAAPRFAAGALALTLAFVGCVLLAPAAAHADARLVILPSFPSPVTVGAKNLPASIVVTNNNTTPEVSLKLCNVANPAPCAGSKGITLLPSCGWQGFGACDATGYDPNVFSIHPNAVGAAGSACENMDFTVTVAAGDAASGKVTITPTVGNVQLPTNGSFCQINLTVDVLALPTKDRMPLTPGLQTVQFADADGVSGIRRASAHGESDDVTVMAAPKITTNASQGAKVGEPVTDSATLHEAYSPTGDVTFKLYGPANATCSGTPAFTATVAINPGGPTTSPEFTPNAAGTYRWVAGYGGDAYNNSASGACNDANEAVVIAKASPSIQTTASAGVTVGAQVTDTATLQGAYNPTGDVTFKLYGPGNATCSGTPAFTRTVAIDPNGPTTSPPITPIAAGTYRWIAGYAGDANNNAASGACNDPNEAVAIAKASPSIQTTASAGVTVGAQVTDTAVLHGAYNPTGDVTFELYGPDDGGCLAGSRVFSKTVQIAPNGTVPSATFIPSVAGTYRWIATYNGDANNTSAAGTCNELGETVVVTKRSPALVTNASSSVVVGGAITDQAGLTGELHPTHGAMTFRLYGPGDTGCTGTPLLATPVTINQDGTATSPPYQTLAPGTYRWVASYGGDANHQSAPGACNDPNESVTVTKASPSIVSNASSAVAVGGQISDSVTLAGEFGQTTGNVTFRLYGPDDATCSAAAVFESTVTINGDGTATSQAFSSVAAGTYRWVASYAGDARNEAAAGVCGDPGESVTVTKASPTMTTNASPTTAVGGSITDSATLAGEFNPTAGSVTFRLYGPGDATCSGTSLLESTVAINADGSATSPSFTATAAGTYRWIASYSGDANNAAAGGACNDASEAVIVGVASPTIVTKASGAVAAGGALTDAASLVGEVNPTAGDVTFRLYGPDNATCTGAAVFESKIAINADGTAKSAAFRPAAPGTYRWLARYSGDANNGGAIGACNDPDESATVAAFVPAAAAVVASPLLCGGTKIALVDVFPEGSHMLISGVAQPSYAGKRATIVLQSTGKPIVSALIGAKGGFAATAKLPAKRLRAGARYQAIVDGKRSVGLKLQRRSYMTRAALRGVKSSFGGKVTGKFRTGTKVTLMKIMQCTKSAPIGTTKLKRDGTWQITLPVPDNVQNLLFRAKTNVLLGRRPHSTFTLPRPLSLSAAP